MHRNNQLSNVSSYAFEIDPKSVPITSDFDSYGLEATVEQSQSRAVAGQRKQKSCNPSSAQWWPNELADCGQKLHQTALEIGRLTRLSDRTKCLVTAAAGFLSSAEGKRPVRVYRQFLQDVLRVYGRGIVMLFIMHVENQTQDHCM